MSAFAYVHAHAVTPCGERHSFVTYRVQVFELPSAHSCRTLEGWGKCLVTGIAVRIHDRIKRVYRSEDGYLVLPAETGERLQFSIPAGVG